MPMPKPKEKETEKEFVDRCVADEAMTGEYADASQRAAVCHSQWDNREGKRAMDPARMRVRGSATFAASELIHGKADDGPGWVEGYVAIYEVVDDSGEVFRKAAFKRSAEQVVPAGQVPLMIRHIAHGGDVLETVGVVTQAKDDDKGLWIHADFFADDQAQTARSRVVEARDAGAEQLYRFSVGFKYLKWSELGEPDGPRVEITEAGLLDATITVFPMQGQAVITGAKGLGDGQRRVIDLTAVLKSVDQLLETLRGKAAADPPALGDAGDVPAQPTRRHSARAAVLRRRLALLTIGGEAGD